MHQVWGEVPIHFAPDGDSYAAPSAHYRGRIKSLTLEIEVPFAYADTSELSGKAVLTVANPTLGARVDVLDARTLRLDAGGGIAIPLTRLDRRDAFDWRRQVAAFGGAADMQGLWNVWRYRPESIGAYGVFGVHYLAGKLEMRFDSGAGLILANSERSSVPVVALQQSAAIGYRTARVGAGVGLKYAQLLDLDTQPKTTQGPFAVTRPLRDSERDPGQLSAGPYIEFTRGSSLVRFAFSFGVVDNVEQATGEPFDQVVGDPVSPPWSLSIAAGSRF